MSLAVYPGSFDPVTNGHLSIIKSGLVVFDRLIIAVLNNAKKQCLFSTEERMEMIREALREHGDRVEVDCFDGLLVDYAQQHNTRVVLRGLRAVADFDYELHMANINRQLDERVETVFIMAKDAYFYLSSQSIKEVAALGGDISKFVPKLVEKKLKQTLTSG